jgi:predicted metal-binding transcription factor (methanogenesis marker protein 9)
MTTRNTTTTRSAISSKEYTQLKKELDELKTSVEEQGETLKKIHNAIVGDKDFGHEGLVALVRKHERWIESQKYMWAKIYGGIAVGSAIISILLKFILK